MGMLLRDWPVACPKGWCMLFNQPQTEAELEAPGRCVARREPYGGEQWVSRTAEELGLKSTLRAAHRSRKGQLNR